MPPKPELVDSSTSPVRDWHRGADSAGGPPLRVSESNRRGKGAAVHGTHPQSGLDNPGGPQGVPDGTLDQWTATGNWPKIR